MGTRLQGQTQFACFPSLFPSLSSFLSTCYPVVYNHYYDLQIVNVHTALSKITCYLNTPRYSFPLPSCSAPSSCSHLFFHICFFFFLLFHHLILRKRAQGILETASRLVVASGWVLGFFLR